MTQHVDVNLYELANLKQRVEILERRCDALVDMVIEAERRTIQRIEAPRPYQSPPVYRWIPGGTVD